jgi:hypothetical protein
MMADSSLRFREDVDGCACIHCRDVEYDVRQRSLVDSMGWSARLAVTHPSIVLVFVVLGALQLLIRYSQQQPGTASAVLGVTGVFVARGYVGVVGTDVLRNRTPAPTAAIVTVVRRLSNLAGAVVVAVGGVTVAVLFVDRVVVRAARRAFRLGGIEPVYAELGVLVLTAVSIVYLLVKLWFVPEACFVGGYGPTSALQVSWTITTLHFRKAVAIVGGFVVLFGVGILLDAELAGSESPVVLSIQYGDTAILLRSFGLSVTSGVHFVFDVLSSALYFGVFVHEYVQSVVD